MYEVDFIPVGQAGRHGDAIAIRILRAETGEYAHLVIDAGFEESGQQLVEHVRKYYGTNSIDIAIVTHPDGDHIGGMGTVVRELDVDTLWIHRIGERGGSGLPAAEAVDNLMGIAEREGTKVFEPFAGDQGIGGVLTVLGPTEVWYEELARAQQEEAPKRATKARTQGRAFLEHARHMGQRALAALPVEIAFDDADGTNPRNNSSIVSQLVVDGQRLLLPADAGVPALDRAWDWLEAHGEDTSPPNFVQMPHHGSRKNGSSALLDRLLGRTGQPQVRASFVNVGPDAERHPSPRIANAFMRRGYKVFETKGKALTHSQDAPQRSGWSPAVPMDPLDETDER